MYRRASANVEIIYDYKDAVETEANIKPIRGTDIKPLGPRRYKDMQIRKDADANIHCQLYATDVVTFKPDGQIVVRLNGWTSQTTAQFASSVLGVGFYLFNNKMWCKAKFNGEVGEFPLRSQEDNLFVRGEGSGFRLSILNPEKNKVHKITRVGANKVRARYASFRKYMRNMAKLRSTDEKFVVDMEEMRPMFSIDGKYVSPPRLRAYTHFKPAQSTMDEFRRLITDNGEDKTQDFYRAFLWLVIGMENFGRFGEVSKDNLFRICDEVLFFMHRDEVFEEVEYFGEAKRDLYARFF